MRPARAILDASRVCQRDRVLRSIDTEGLFGCRGGTEAAKRGRDLRG